jgi:putative transposase
LDISAPSQSQPRWPLLALDRHRSINALAETINGLYKAEVVHRRSPWRNLEAVEFATLDWVDWFNNRRLLEPIGFIPPAEAEERYFAMLNDKAMAA